MGTSVYCGHNLPHLVDIGLRWLPKLGVDQSPCPYAHRRTCRKYVFQVLLCGLKMFILFNSIPLHYWQIKISSNIEAIGSFVICWATFTIMLTIIKQFVRPDFFPKSNIQRIQKKFKAHKLSHCSKIKMNGKKLSNFQFHIPGLLWTSLMSKQETFFFYNWTSEIIPFIGFWK